MRKILSAITAFLVVACFNNMFIIGQTTTTQNPDSGLPAAIPDNNPAGVNLPFTFSGLSGSLTNVRVEGMTWSPVHTWSGDLTATLTAPGGSPTATIFQRKGRATPCTSGAGSASDLTGPYTFRDDPTGSPGNFHTIATNPVPSGQYQATRCVTTAGEVILMDGIFAGPVFGPDYLVGKNFYGTEEKGLESFRNMSPEAANGTWILNINDQASGDVGTVTAIQLSLVTNTIVAAGASISGRVVNADGQGIRNVMIVVTGGVSNEQRTVQTSAFGKYQIDDLPVGQTYVITVISKKYFFQNATRIVNLKDNITELDFEAESQ